MSDHVDLEIDGIKWTQLPGINYGYDFFASRKWHLENGLTELDWIRSCFEDSLWFLVYFGLRVSIANQPWWIQACREVQRGPKNNTLDLWARDHGKSTIITTADTIHRILLNPEERVGIFSYSRPTALAFLRGIKTALEQSSLLKAAFPDILYGDPQKESPKWSEEGGIRVKRKGYYKEETVEAWGLIEGMPTGRHFSHRVYDDIVTLDTVGTPEMMAKVRQAFDMSENLGTADGTCRIIGTPYHHEDTLMQLRAQTKDSGEPLYHVRLKPATVDGTPNGASAYLPEEKLAKLRTNRRTFYSQQLLDPTPQGTQKLDKNLLVEVEPSQIPQRLFKFMAIDPAGERKSDNRQGDSWAMVVIGVEPYRDDLGASRFFILDMIVEPMSPTEAVQNAVKMFMRNGQIRQLGVEKVGLSTTEVHISKALHARGRSVTVENKNLLILRPAGRSKEQRIEDALAWPLVNGKLHISKQILPAYRERLKVEMDKFPYWHDDALDAISYVVSDMVRGFRFGKYEPDKKPEPDWWDEPVSRVDVKPDAWLYV